MFKCVRGFTLMEVLVALAVLAITLAAMSKSLNVHIQHSSYLKDKTIAHWIAMNKITELRLQNAFPVIGESQGKVLMNDREWGWLLKTTSTIDPDLRQLEIAVSLKENNAPITLLTGFVTKP